MKNDDGNPPIEVDYTGLTQELGSVRLPAVLPRYWIYLASDGEQLGEREYALLVQVLLLREAQDFELRVSNLPARCPESSRTRALARLRRMGLVFTRRLYYPPRSGRPPVLRAQSWDLRTLFFNLEQAAQSWQAGQRQALARWQAGGRREARPIYSFPPGFVQEIVLPAPVALDIVRGAFYPVAPKWQQRARSLLEALASAHPAANRPEAQAAPGEPPGKFGQLAQLTQPGQPELSAQLMQAGQHTQPGQFSPLTQPAQPDPSAYGQPEQLAQPEQLTQPGQPDAQELRAAGLVPGAQDVRAGEAVAHHLRGHLLKDKEEEAEEEQPTLPQLIFSFFSERLGQRAYQPSAKEQAALAGLLRDGFTFAQITAGIEAAFARPARPRHFTHCAAIARDLRRSAQAARQPETRTAPEYRQPEARTAEPLPAAPSAYSAPAPAAYPAPAPAAQRLTESIALPFVAPLPAAPPTAAYAGPLPAEAGGAPAGDYRFPDAQPPDLVIDAHLAGAVDVYRSAGREITPDVLARFNLMAARCDPAAHGAGSRGGAWLADALAGALGVARPGSLLNYADAVLNDWIANGRSRPPDRSAEPARGARQEYATGGASPAGSRRRRAPGSRAEPKAHQGIRDYLVQRGEEIDGKRD